MKQSSLAEVSASSAPKDVVGAIVSSAAAPPKAPNNPMKAFQVAFVFIFIFALVIYFREEIYTFSKGEQCLRAAKGACTRHADPCMHEAWSAVLHGTQSCSMRALSKPHWLHVCALFTDVSKHPILAKVENDQVWKERGKRG
jgi:hypothetical protein